MSRSATIACAYLMKKHNLSYDAALERLRTARPCVYPNAGFARQLRLYHSLNYIYTPEQSDQVKQIDKVLPTIAFFLHTDGSGCLFPAIPKGHML